MFDLVSLELLTVNFRITCTINLRPLPVSFDVGGAALSTFVQNVVATCLPRVHEHVASNF